MRRSQHSELSGCWHLSWIWGSTGSRLSDHTLDCLAVFTAVVVSSSFVPGLTFHLTSSCQVFKEEKYLKEAAECAEIIWQRGLLRKGYGICHGTAGNGYAFLSLYKLSQDKKYLYRVCKVRTGLRTQVKHKWECLTVFCATVAAAHCGCSWLASYCAFLLFFCV